MRASPTHIRLLCGLWLLTLVGSWSPHAHSTPQASGLARSAPTSTSATASASTEEGDTRDFGGRVSSDDAHHEHSVVLHGTGSDCGICRSAEEREADRVGRHPLLGSFETRVLRNLVRADRLRSVLFERLQPSRAPPVWIEA